MKKRVNLFCKKCMIDLELRWSTLFPPDLLDRGLAGCEARLMVASLKGPHPTLFLARTLY